MTQLELTHLVQAIDNQMCRIGKISEGCDEKQLQNLEGQLVAEDFGVTETPTLGDPQEREKILEEVTQKETKHSRCGFVSYQVNCKALLPL